MLSYRMRNTHEIIEKAPVEKEGEEGEEKGWTGEWTLDVPNGFFFYFIF